MFKIVGRVVEIVTCPKGGEKEALVVYVGKSDGYMSPWIESFGFVHALRCRYFEEGCCTKGLGKHHVSVRNCDLQGKMVAPRNSKG